MRSGDVILPRIGIAGYKEDVRICGSCLEFSPTHESGFVRSDPVRRRYRLSSVLPGARHHQSSPESCKRLSYIELALSALDLPPLSAFGVYQRHVFPNGWMASVRELGDSSSRKLLSTGTGRTLTVDIDLGIQPSRGEALGPVCRRTGPPCASSFRIAVCRWTPHFSAPAVLSLVRRVLCAILCGGLPVAATARCLRPLHERSEPAKLQERSRCQGGRSLHCAVVRAMGSVRTVPAERKKQEDPTSDDWISSSRRRAPRFRQHGARDRHEVHLLLPRCGICVSRLCRGHLDEELGNTCMRRRILSLWRHHLDLSNCRRSSSLVGLVNNCGTIHEPKNWNCTGLEMLAILELKKRSC